MDEKALNDLNLMPTLQDNRPPVTDPVVAYQTTTLLTGVVQRGTAKLLQKLDHPIAVKSGTTNEFKDAWMAGCSPNLVVVVFVGFDTPRTLGNKHFGAVVAGPIFLNFMEKALSDEPVRPFTVPRGAKFVRVNADTGQRAEPGDINVITEVLPSKEGDTGDDNEEMAESTVDFDQEFEKQGGNQGPWEEVGNNNSPSDLHMRSSEDEKPEPSYTETTPEKSSPTHDHSSTQSTSGLY